MSVADILVISLSNIGDAVMTTPVLESLHRLYPESRIDVVADRRSSIIFSECNYIHRIFHKDKKAGWKGLFALIIELRKNRYRLLIDLRTDGLTWLLRGEQRLTKRGITPEGPHAVQQHMAVIAPLLSGVAERASTVVHVGDDTRQQATSYLAPLPGKRWLAIGPGANWPGKIWPAAHYAKLCNTLADEMDGIVILGGPDDQSLAEQVMADIQMPAVDLCGRTNLLEVEAVLQRCAAFVGNDSGLGHLASAAGIPALAVFGPGRPERYRPWGERCDYILAPDLDLSCLTADSVADRLRSMLQVNVSE